MNTFANLLFALVTAEMDIDDAKRRASASWTTRMTSLRPWEGEKGERGAEPPVRADVEPARPLLSISVFARRSRLSMKALRLYDRLGLLTPADVDPGVGYRRYRESLMVTARLVVMLRRLDMPLAQVAVIVSVPARSVSSDPHRTGRRSSAVWPASGSWWHTSGANCQEGTGLSNRRLSPHGASYVSVAAPLTRH
jgi:DNA-binding transcriptional MerR regulator